MKLELGDWTSPFVISDDWEGPGRDYQLFGYPLDAFYDDISIRYGPEQLIGRPDLIFSKGHIRRRLSCDLGIPNVKSSRFLELSTVAGEGCSGSPIFYTSTSGKWRVIGVYVGEKINDRTTSVSYAVRAESFSGWRPAGFDRSVKEESESA